MLNNELMINREFNNDKLNSLIIEKKKGISNMITDLRDRNESISGEITDEDDPLYDEYIYNTDLIDENENLDPYESVAIDIKNENKKLLSGAEELLMLRNCIFDVTK